MKVVLEGVTGSGKSSTLAALAELGFLPELVVNEDATFGDLMDEIAAGAAKHADRHTFVRRLQGVLEWLERDQPRSFLLERFHLSYYALVPDWSRYREIDRALASAEVKVALLVVPDRRLRERSLLRREYGSTDWQDFGTRFGSEANAIEALRASQQRRLDAIEWSEMRALVVDTSDEDWKRCAREIASFAGDQS